MAGEIRHESRFSRSLANHAKLGAYYTDVGHCMAMRRFLNFPREEEILCLEPSIGDGMAIKAVTGKEGGDNIHIFGVDISDEAVEKVSKDPLIDSVLRGDFVKDVNISQKAFSFIFSNPPYMVADDEIRYEDKFLERFSPFLKKDGILFYVVPYAQFTRKNFFLKLINRYVIQHVYRFQDGEYQKWHQVVIMAVRRGSNKSYSGSERDTILEKYLVEEDIPVLPFDYAGARMDVPSSALNVLSTFHTVTFPVGDALRAMQNGTGIAGEILRNFHKALNPKVSVASWNGGISGKPPIHPSKGSMYLLGVCGVGSGLCGSEKEGNLHLERGVVKMRETARRENGKDEESPDLIVSTISAQITYNVIENDGKITNLQ